MSMTGGLGDLNTSQSNLMKLATLNSSFQQQQSIDQDMETFEKKLLAEAESFEESLVSETTNPLKRALSRYDFYTRQDEQRQERKRELGSLVKRKERGFQQYTTTQQRLEKKCNSSNHHDFDAYLCLGQGGQLVEKTYYGPLLVYSSNSTAGVTDGSDDEKEENKNLLGSASITGGMNTNGIPSGGGGSSGIGTTLGMKSTLHHHEKSEELEEMEHSDDDLIHEAILEEQKHLIETFTAMQNGELPPPTGIASKPVYLGEDGTLYNLYYEPLPKQDSNMLRGRGKFSQLAYGSSVKSAEGEIVDGIMRAKQLKDKKNLTSEEELIVKKFGQVVNSEDLVNKYVRRGRMLDRYEYQHDPDLYLSAPDPESFTSFDDYEEALLNWTKQVESKLGYLQLPRVMGRHYFRPAERSASEGNDNGSNVGVNGSDQRSNPHLHSSRHISENLTAIALRGGYDDDQTEGSNNMGHETWEAQLTPLEPKVQFYETFKEYEMAMIRWAIVTLGLPFLPPHVAQYQTLLGLKLVNEPTFQISGVKVSSQDNEEKEDLETNINDDEDRIDDDKVSVRYEVKNEWETLNPKHKQEITNSIQHVVNTKLDNKKKYGSYHRPVLPNVHGTLKSENKAVPLKLITQGERTRPENMRSWIIYQRQKKSLSCVPAHFTIAYESANASDFEHQIPLRRKDLTPEDIRASQDCEQVERDKVTFESPEFDLGEINFELLSETPNYMMFLQIVLARKDNEKRFNHLNSWYFPKEEQYALSQIFGDLCSILDRVEHPSQMKVSHFESIFQSPVYLDYFQKFLNTDLKLRMSMMKNGNEIAVETYGKLMFCSTTKQHFSAVLNFFHNCNSPLTHVKVAHFVKEFLKQENAKDIISEYLQDDDYTTLHYIARAVTLFDEVPVQLYEFTESTRNVVINIVLSDGKKKEDSTLRMVDKFLVNLLMLYYTNCISVSLVEEDKAYPHVYPFLVSKLEKYIDEVNKYLKCSKSFLKSHIWKILGSRSKSVTALGKFVLSFLFFLSWKEDIKNALKSEDTELLTNIRKLASSTFSHVQNATARLFPLLKEYEDLLTKDYRVGQSVLRDLDLSETKSARKAVVDSRPPLVASMVLEFLNESLTVKKEEFGTQQDAYYYMIVGLIESRVFTLVLDEVLATVTQKRVHQGTVMGSLFIAKFAKFLVCNQLVQRPQEKSNESTSTKWDFLKGALRRKEVVEVKQALYSGSKVEINNTILLSMWDFIGKPDRLRKTYRPRCAMLIAFRHLTKVPEIFNLITKDSMSNFYTKLLELCKDDVDMEFNRNAWRLFYQLIKFHGEDVMKDIVNHNMSSFLNLITVQKSIIATNALHYFNKIFNLPIERVISIKLNSFATPELACEKGYNVPQKTHAQYLKTVDLLISFIINKNMVEAIFSNAYNLWSKDFKGWPFQSLATLFYTLNTHSACTKLQQAFTRAGIGNTLNTVCKMVSAPDDSSYNDYKRRFKLDKDVMDWNMKHKHYLYIKPDEKK